MIQRFSHTVACWLMLVTLIAVSDSVPADDLTQVFSEQTPLDDARLKPPRQLRDAYHPWVPPTTKSDWEQTAQHIREQILVAGGLWPMWEKTPLNTVVHGAIERDGYIVEKVFFASRPGHYVTGNLYRPAKIEGKVPGILCPHGHWADGRFYQAGDKAQAELDSGAESFEAGAQFPLQARFVQLARMGCIVFHYDMLGYADSTTLAHRTGMDDVKSLLWQNNKLGLQTWNSIRALDFLLTLPDVDPQRLAVTGASGGGTQTMLLAAVDERVAVAFPAVMVSTGMQGGCICENASYLRVGLNNVAFAAAFAPKPQKMSGADDWTIAIETKGLPELKQVYALYGQANLVDARALTQFKHNYNQHSRELMYNWFNEYLDLGLPSPVTESEFEPIPPDQLSVFDAEHPLPADALDDAALQEQMIQQSRRQFAALADEAVNDPAEFKRVIGTAARVMLGEFPAADDITTETTGEERIGDVQLLKGWSRRPTGQGADNNVVPWIALVPDDADGTAVLWIHGDGKQHLLSGGEPTAEVRKLLDARMVVASIDMFGTGEYAADALTDRETMLTDGWPGFLYCYNRPLLAEWAQDIAATISTMSSHEDVQTVHLIGTGGAGPAALLARAITPAAAVEHTIVDLEGASFENVTKTTDPLLLPAALKYGGLAGFANLAMPAKLTVNGVADPQKSTFDPVLARDAGAGLAEISTSSLDLQALVKTLRK